MKRRDFLKVACVPLIGIPSLPDRPKRLSAIPKDSPLDQGFVVVHTFGGEYLGRFRKLMRINTAIYKDGKAIRLVKTSVPMQYANQVGMRKLYKNREELDNVMPENFQNEFPGLRCFLAYQQDYEWPLLKGIPICCQL